MSHESPNAFDTIIPNHGPSMTPRSRQERHERAVANTLCWAQEAAGHEAFSDALEWLHVVELVDGALTPGWDRKRASWRTLDAQQQ
jgi:hypothetical protein